MKRYAIVLAILSIMTVWLSGCIISSSPSTSAVTIKVGDAQTFAVTGVLNGPYTWYLNGNPIDGVTGASYTYTAVLENLGANTLMVVTQDKLSGKDVSKQWTVTVVDDLPPIADAGPDQNLYFGAPVQLDGSASSDPEGEPLTYVWEIVGRPAGSSAALNNPNAMSPVFVPDVQGAYTIALIVNDGRLTSEPDIVIIKSYTDYGPPTANAGDDQGVVFPGVVHLDGSGSTDPEGTPLTYQWKIDSGPAGSVATLDDPTSKTPNFTPDKKGVYVVSLVVNNGLYDSGIDLVVITVYNNAPVARAGTDITVATLGGTAQLDGSNSSDPDGTALTYAWTITSRPYSSIAPLNDPAIAKPTFTPDKKGAYTMQLVVSDGELSSSADTVIVTCSNQVPVANAGVPINIPFGATAQLNGSASDPDGDPMTYAWTEISKPSGSVAALSNAAILNPTFHPDLQGTYTFALAATDNTGLSSAPSTVTVSTNNHQPIANAGADIIMSSNSSVVLNGSGEDVDGDPLTYTWRVISAPMGSGGDSTLSALNIAKPTFTPDKKGDYELGLIVNDGQVDSLESTMKIHVINNAPVANAGGPTRDVHYYNRFVTLDGSGSYDPDGDPLTYSWRIISKPAGSTATLTNSTSAYPSITVDVPQGTWVIGLTVNDGYMDSAESTININYIEHQPVANAGPNQSGHAPYGTPLTFQLDGSNSSDADGDTLTYTWRVISGTGLLSDSHAMSPTLTTSSLGPITLGLKVNDGLMDSVESQVTVTTTNATPTANAGSPQSAHIRYGNTVTFQLTGSANDTDGDTLTYTWRIISGGTGTFSDTSAISPTFTVSSLGGPITLGLKVSDGWVNSTESTVTVTTTNATPTANAGGSYTVHYANRNNFQLNGSGSSSGGDGDTLTYTWTQTSGPTVTLNVSNPVYPTFTMAVPGTYTFNLKVDDGWASSNSTATATNSSDNTTYSTTWPNTTFTPWVVNENSTAAGYYGFGTDQYNSSPYSYKIQSCPPTCGSYTPTCTCTTNFRFSRNLPADTYVMSVSAYVAYVLLAPSSAAFYEGSNPISGGGITIPTLPYSWSQTTITLNRVLSNIGLRAVIPGGKSVYVNVQRTVYWDDIVVTYWN